MNERLRIAVVHGEGRSLWHVVDGTAPEAEQPCVLATGRSREEAEAMREKLLKGGCHATDRA